MLEYPRAVGLGFGMFLDLVADEYNSAVWCQDCIGAIHWSAGVDAGPTEIDHIVLVIGRQKVAVEVKALGVLESGAGIDLAGMYATADLEKDLDIQHRVLRLQQTQ